ncbi:hypothetical protein A2872_04335 [Candidatus Gottesmanbacteria bacterium RIFCSPHIGHO2_01_FULL_42_12]|uniref:Uncharacterized protein n=1 Tax=Candidatus Gottesmanbacteria bacterium RIFCSPHIGHO2_01_FULL_42_12 TaxID=1798377 RepID=A0A1F5Z127_9BACT|nr:MAG: hypothetical protein A2872_04335 [Candidatus Gottesmanbacteria bacterium RIFCSPHIGHO2_01_FULL_42_12]
MRTFVSGIQSGGKRCPQIARLVWCLKLNSMGRDKVFCNPRRFKSGDGIVFFNGANAAAARRFLTQGLAEPYNA